MRLLRYLSIVFCGVLWPQLAYSQYQQDVRQLQLDSLLSSLRQQRVDTICVYEDYCVGCRGYRISDDSPCRTKGILIPTYIFWKQAGHNYGRKLDNCSLGCSKEIYTTSFWPYFIKYSHLIRRDSIKQFVNMDYGAVASFGFYIQSDTVSHYFKPINLAKQIKHSSLKNRYYRHNIRTRTVQLWRLLEEAVAAEFAEPK